jgi:hypothetical protein
MKCPILTALAFGAATLWAQDRTHDSQVVSATEYVHIILKTEADPQKGIWVPVTETKPRELSPIGERVLDKIQIEQSPPGSSPSYVVCGRVVSTNTGTPIESAFIYLGPDGFAPKLAAMTNLDGEFKFRLYLNEHREDWDLWHKPDMSSFLYVSGDPTSTPSRELRLSEGGAARYSLKRLLEITQAAKK